MQWNKRFPTFTIHLHQCHNTNSNISERNEDTATVWPSIFQFHTVSALITTKIAISDAWQRRRTLELSTLSIHAHCLKDTVTRRINLDDVNTRCYYTANRFAFCFDSYVEISEPKTAARVHEQRWHQYELFNAYIFNRQTGYGDARKIHLTGTSQFQNEKINYQLIVRCSMQQTMKQTALQSSATSKLHA